ncbi:MAG: FHA domain-containing protein, partial [Chloroflexi bacterium]|nr:FHA domain-containing protein [Chloroflexota bacterium]
NAWAQPQAPAQDPWAQQQAAQDPWAQQQAPAQNAWGTPQPQQGPGGGSSSGPAWGQQPADPWAAPAAQQPYQGMGAAAAPAGASAMPSWQQGGAGVASDADRTVLRTTGGQGPQAAPGSGLGIVRVEEGKEPGRVYEVRKDSLSIGRSRESDIFLEDLAVSRLHASIVNMGNGNYALKDEGSANGTKVNGQLVNKYQTYPLQEGDRIQLGQTVLVFARR